MDLSVIKEALGNFNTFTDAIAKLFQGLPNLFHLLGTWFSDTDKNGKLGIADAWATTEGIFKAAAPAAETAAETK